MNQRGRSLSVMRMVVFALRGRIGTQSKYKEFNKLPVHKVLSLKYLHRKERLIIAYEYQILINRSIIIMCFKNYRVDVWRKLPYKATDNCIKNRDVVQIIIKYLSRVVGQLFMCKLRSHPESRRAVVISSFDAADGV